MVSKQSGVTWSGNAIDATSGLYAVSNVGNYTFTYTYGTGTCLVTDQVTLTVNALPVVGAGSDVSYCVDAGIQTMVGSPSGGICTTGRLIENEEERHMMWSWGE